MYLSDTQRTDTCQIDKLYRLFWTTHMFILLYTQAVNRTTYFATHEHQSHEEAYVQTDISSKWHAGICKKNQNIPALGFIFMGRHAPQWYHRRPKLSEGAWSSSPRHVNRCFQRQSPEIVNLAPEGVSLPAQSMEAVTAEGLHARIDKLNS